MDLRGIDRPDQSTTAFFPVTGEHLDLPRRARAFLPSGRVAFAWYAVEGADLHIQFWRRPALRSKPASGLPAIHGSEAMTRCEKRRYADGDSRGRGMERRELALPPGFDGLGATAS